MIVDEIYWKLLRHSDAAAPKTGIFCAIVGIINNHRSNHLTTGSKRGEFLLTSTHSLSE
ncbi:hypothetical protein AC26_1359 [Escherichia coli 1-176-05_S3_C2]|nr:hypothetical protein AC26_1359 [Escherichia coli 1-176-05_S3_C2]